MVYKYGICDVPVTIWRWDEGPRGDINGCHGRGGGGGGGGIRDVYYSCVCVCVHMREREGEGEGGEKERKEDSNATCNYKPIVKTNNPPSY